jgi:hypothetical protein
MHAEQKRERLDRLHVVDEGQHQRERGRAAQPGEQPHPEAEQDAQQHEGERLPLQDEQQPFQQRLDQVIRRT